MKKVPLTYNGVQVGECEVEFTDEGAMVKGTIYDSEKAVEILGPSIQGVSYGFEPDPKIDLSGVEPNDLGIDFNGIQPNDHMVAHFRDNTPIRYGYDKNGAFGAGKENDEPR